MGKANDGSAWRKGPLRVIVTVGQELDNRTWVHVSCSVSDRLATWEELAEVKRAFIGDDKTAIQVLPPQSKYVNIDEVLHLFHCLDGDPLPDFTHGTGSI
jgi:hypothetical protein